MHSFLKYWVSNSIDAYFNEISPVGNNFSYYGTRCFISA